MDSRIIKLTLDAWKYGNINIPACGKDFFPTDSFGTSSKKSGCGIPITLVIQGLTNPIRTDIPVEKDTGRPRRFFRERTWVKEFVRENNLKVGDSITITHTKNRTYEIIPFAKHLTFIDLFAGIGGIRTAFEKCGAKCVFSSEWDKQCQITYHENFGEWPAGDITKIHESDIPDHDILVGGFPCQPFSIAGVSKKNSLGKAHGFEDKTQGTLFFDILRILKTKQPRAFVLENVRNLKSHDGGQTFAVITRCLEDLGYNVAFGKSGDTIHISSNIYLKKSLCPEPALECPYRG